MNLHRINSRIISLIESKLRAWKITLEVTTDQGPTHIGPIDVNRGILQGDSFCVQLFTMCLNPIAWYIRGTEGYSISKDKNRKVTHNLFVDDLKTYHKSQSKATLITNTVKGMFEDIGLSWGLQKCAAVRIKKGKIMQSSELPLTSGDNIPVLGEDDYNKFLGKCENSVQLEGKVLELASKEFVRRLHIIWSSPLTVPRKVKATNCFAIPVLQYHMWSSDWPISSLQELDRNARKIICKFKGKHYHESNPLLYLPPERGGRGCQEITQLYKTTKKRPTTLQPVKTSV